MLIDLNNPAKDMFTPKQVAATIQALIDDELYIKGGEGVVYHAEHRASYLYVVSSWGQVGLQGGFASPSGWATYIGGVTCLFALLMSEAKEADRIIDESDIPFGEDHQDTPPFEKPLTPEEIEQVMSSFDEDWAKNSLDIPDSPL